MIIDEKIGSNRDSIMHILNRMKNDGKEYAIQALEELGLEYYDAKQLVDLFEYNIMAGSKLGDAWNNARRTKEGNLQNYNEDVRPYNEDLLQSEKQFEKKFFQMALLITVNGMESDEITDEILKQMLEAGIEVSQIKKPGIQIAYKYYKESRDKDKLLDSQIIRREKAERITNESIGDDQKHNAEINKLADIIRQLREELLDLQDRYRIRIESDENQFQLALDYIKILIEALKESQKEGFLKRVSRKIISKFTRKSGIPKKPPELKETLLSRIERMGVDKMSPGVSRENNYCERDTGNGRKSSYSGERNP